MDERPFDALLRSLTRAGSRRQAVAGALAALTGGVMIGTNADARPGGDQEPGRRKRKPNVQGPCGDGTRKDNACTKDKQCCTGICRKGLKNKDGKGRCRCLRKGKPCTEDRNCCGGRACTDGVCGKSGCTSDADCTGASDTCTNGICTCGGTICAAGEQCLHGGCTACSCAACASIDCSNPTVTSGGSVQAAIDAAGSGAVITIAPGTYSEDLVLPAGASLTLVGCGFGANEVILRNSAYGSRTIDASAGVTLDLIDIVVQGYNDLNTEQPGGGIESVGTLNICARSRVEDGLALYGAGIIISGPDANTISHLLVTDRAIIQRNRGITGAGVALGDYALAEVTGSAQIYDNHTDTYSGGFLLNSNSALRLAGNASVHGNTAGRGAGGYLVGTSTLTVEENATITGNTATNDGGGVYGTPSGGNTLNAVSGSITGNTPDNCSGEFVC
jgi:parallel beta-helix repeat protein